MSTTEPPHHNRKFAHIKPLTESQYATQHAEAIWHDLTSTWYGKPALRKHPSKVNDKAAWRFPYCDRVYVAHRPPEGNRWHVSLWLAPDAPTDAGLPHEPAHAAALHGTPLVLGKPTLQVAVRTLAQELVGSTCDHGYTRGRDSCPGCDSLEGLYEELP